VTRVAVVTAVRQETRAVLDALVRVERVRGAACPTWTGSAGGAAVTVVEGGVGRECAARAAATLASKPALLVSCGFAGALREDLAAGTPAICERVVWESEGRAGSYDVDAALLARVRSALPRDLTPAPVGGTLLSSPIVLAAVSAKSDAGRTHRAVAVEMEAAPLAEHARTTGIDFLPLRVILDPIDLSLEGLPPGIGSSWLARTRLLARPGVWPTIVALRSHAAAATAMLTHMSRVLLPALAEHPAGRYSNR
jgi:nucleoside phosphorylase